MPPTFRFKASYMNETWFEVVADGERFQVVYRHGLSDYERSIHTGGSAGYAIDCEPVVGFLRRQLGYLPLSLDLVRDFNAWRVAERDRWIKTMGDFPQRYGPITPEDRAVKDLALGAAQWLGGWAKDGGHWRLDHLPEDTRLAA